VSESRSKTVLVTGASRGLGAAIARRLAAGGYAVAINYRSDEDAAHSVAADIVAHGGRARAYRADVSIERDVVAMFGSVGAELGSLTGLVNNAGITGGFAHVDEVSAATLHDVFAVNVTGAFLCCREAVRRMSTRHGGSGGVIINVSSRAAALGGASEWVHYAASKGALDTLTIGLAKEVAPEGIRVNAVAVGFADTTLHAAAGKPDRAWQLAQTTPLGRPADPDEVAAAVAWLMSQDASYITGAILPVSGGR
jgi:NAD(P)-dependent dehydrogenase (short-subunit alcohol dehydrogenase family)